MMSVYGILSVGVSLHLHYCDGKISNYSFYEPVESCCDHDDDCGDNAMIDNNCCSFADIDLKIDQEHEASFVRLAFPQFIAEKSYVVIQNEAVRQDFIPVQDHEGPPDAVPIYIRHQSLVFYA